MVFFLCFTIVLIRFYSNDRHHLIPTVQITLIYLLLIRLPGTVQRRNIGMQVCWNCFIHKSDTNIQHTNTNTYTSVHCHPYHAAFIDGYELYGVEANEPKATDKRIGNCNKRTHTARERIAERAVWEWADWRDRSMRVHSVSEVIVWMGFNIINMNTNIHMHWMRVLFAAKAAAPQLRVQKYTFCEYFRVSWSCCLLLLLCRVVAHTSAVKSQHHLTRTYIRISLPLSLVGWLLGWLAVPQSTTNWNECILFILCVHYDFYLITSHHNVRLCCMHHTVRRRIPSAPLFLLLYAYGFSSSFFTVWFKLGLIGRAIVYMCTTIERERDTHNYNTFI